MNKKVLALLVATASLLLATPFANAYIMNTWTDRASYGAGDSGTLYFYFYNDGGSALTIKKVTIVFQSWYAYRNGGWEGNQTLDVNQAVAVNGAYENNTRFTVPTDGRAQSTTVAITFSTAERGDVHLTGYVVVEQTPRYADQIVLWLTLLDVLVILGAIMIAAAVFLSARRPAVTWSKEQKTE